MATPPNFDATDRSAAVPGLGAVPGQGAVPIRAVIFDLGGVMLSSPFEAFAHYEATQGLPDGFIRRLNMDNHHDNAWARLERGELDADGFARAFEAEALAAGGQLDGHAILAMLVGEVRPEMAAEVHRLIDAGYGTAFLTNNAVPFDDLRSLLPEGLGELLDAVDAVVESAVLGMRKPEEAFYRVALDALGVGPSHVVFLDDLGVNLKPARAMGMTTIKVEEPRAALAELRAVLEARPRPT